MVGGGRFSDERTDHMTREVFIFGTYHELQCGAAECEADNISLLEREIRRIVTKYGIRRIAEEMSDDALQKSSAGDQAPKKLYASVLPETTSRSISSILT